MRIPKSNSQATSQDWLRELLLSRFVDSDIKLNIKLNIRLNIKLNALFQLIKQFCSDIYSIWPIQASRREESKGKGRESERALPLQLRLANLNGFQSLALLSPLFGYFLFAHLSVCTADNAGPQSYQHVCVCVLPRQCVCASVCFLCVAGLVKLAF